MKLIHIDDKMRQMTADVEVRFWHRHLNGVNGLDMTDAPAGVQDAWHAAIHRQVKGPFGDLPMVVRPARILGGTVCEILHRWSYQGPLAPGQKRDHEARFYGVSFTMKEPFNRIIGRRHAFGRAVRIAFPGAAYMVRDCWAAWLARSRKGQP